MPDKYRIDHLCEEIIAQVLVNGFCCQWLLIDMAGNPSIGKHSILAFIEQYFTSALNLIQS